MEPNARLLILGGIHGAKNGKLGKFDQDIENDTLHQIEMLKEDRKDEIEDFNTTIIYECVGNYLDKDTWKPKPDELAQAILKHQPTMLLLAFCYTSQSILNDTLRSQGIYSLLIMQKERETITQSRCIFLDDVQKGALLKFAQTRPKLLMLQGNFGTGKTVLLMEALRIKIAQYHEDKMTLRVIITSDTRQKDLVDYLQSSYQFENVTIEYYECLKDVLIDDKRQKVLNVGSVFQLNDFVKRIGNTVNQSLFSKVPMWPGLKKTRNYAKAILVIDEFFLKGTQDWNQFEPHKDVDVLLSFHPRNLSSHMCNDLLGGVGWCCFAF